MAPPADGEGCSTPSSDITQYTNVSLETNAIQMGNMQNLLTGRPPCRVGYKVVITTPETLPSLPKWKKRGEKQADFI